MEVTEQGYGGHGPVEFGGFCFLFCCQKELLPNCRKSRKRANVRHENRCLNFNHMYVNNAPKNAGYGMARAVSSLSHSRCKVANATLEIIAKN